MSHIEELAGTVSINITGDYTYQSKRKCKRVANLILCNGHYTIAKNPNQNHLKAWYSVPKSPLVYEKNGVENVVKFYDGTTYWNGTVQELNKLKSQRWSGKWCCIEVVKSTQKESSSLDSSQEKRSSETFIRFNEECDALLDKSKKIGLPIDLRLCCGSYKIAALWLFEKLSRSIPANEPLNPIEAQWISDTMRGGLIWSENGWKGYGRQYDYTSLYPHLLTKYFFPISEGEFQTVNSIYYKNGDKKFMYYGIFHAEVEYQKEVTSLFRYNNKNMYTHYDLTLAESLNLKITLFQDNAPNVLSYKPYPGNILFGPYVEILFNISGSV